jgi:hypothetical protein
MISGGLVREGPASTLLHLSLMPAKTGRCEVEDIVNVQDPGMSRPKLFKQDSETPYGIAPSASVGDVTHDMVRNWTEDGEVLRESSASREDYTTMTC